MLDTRIYIADMVGAGTEVDPYRCVLNDLILFDTQHGENLLGTALEQDGAVYRFTTNALEQAPSGGGGGSVIVIPLVTGRTTTVRLVDNVSMELVQGDTYRLTFSLGQDYTGWTPNFAARLKNSDGTYAATYSMAVRSAVWTDATIGAGYVDLSETDTATLALHYAELEMVNGSQHNTRERYEINIIPGIIT